MLVTRGDLEASLAVLRSQIEDPRAGILGPRSITWRIGGDLAIFLGGGRAAFLQLAHPPVAYAIDQHSHTRADVTARFQGTFRHVFAMVFGDLDEAFGAARRVHAIHAGIHGAIPEPIGRWAAGAPYHANDADALRWVHATLVDTTVLVREQLGGALPEGIKDGYVIEMNRLAALFGIPPSRLPGSWAAHAAYMRAMFASDQLAVAPCARAMAAFLIGRGGARQPPLGRVAEAVTALLLPPHLADQFALRHAPRVARLGLDAFGLAGRLVPEVVSGLPARAAARRRLHGRPPSLPGAWLEAWFGAWIDRQLFGLARRTTGTAR